MIGGILQIGQAPPGLFLSCSVSLEFRLTPLTFIIDAVGRFDLFFSLTK
jgi:hypothetical protein